MSVLIVMRYFISRRRNWLKEFDAYAIMELFRFARTLSIKRGLPTCDLNNHSTFGEPLFIWSKYANWNI